MPHKDIKRRREYCRKYHRAWQEKNQERVNAQARLRRKENPEKYRAAARKKEKKYRERADVRIRRSLSSRIRNTLQGRNKSARTTELLGCPVVWLEVHLESLFKPGMTWENYGPVWHVDHVRPCSSFDLTRPEQQRFCFHWTNLQPVAQRRKETSFQVPGGRTKPGKLKTPDGDRAYCLAPRPL